MTGRWTLVLHGGAGVNPARDYSEVQDHLLALVTEGAARLEAGESALDTTQWAVAAMEASGLYVAGRGSAPNRAGILLPGEAGEVGEDILMLVMPVMLNN